jgi:hypothetical protein
MKDYTITIYQDIQPNRKSSFWFNGNVATIEYKGYKFIIDAVGEINIEGDIKDIETDNDLSKVVFLNNNWFSLTMVLPNNELVYDDMLDFDIAFEDDIEEAIKRVVLSMEELIND